MKIWILRPAMVGKVRHPIWDCWYDKVFGFIIRAESEAEARKIASENASNEGRSAWLDYASSTCEELTSNGPSGVILIDEHNA